MQKVREVRAEKVREKELEDLTAEFKVKRDNILRQAVHTQPELVESAAEKIQLHYPRTAPRTQFRFSGIFFLSVIPIESNGKEFTDGKTDPSEVSEIACHEKLSKSRTQPYRRVQKVAGHMTRR